MSTAASSTLTLITFADLRSDVWGFAWLADQSAVAVGGPGRETALHSPQLEGAGPDEEWALHSDRGTLTLTPLSDPYPADRRDSYDQLCRVSGALAASSDREQVIDCLARRTQRPLPAPSETDSTRDFSAFFEPDRGVTLHSTRPRRARGQEGDSIVAVLFDSEATHAVADPRLSTTYAAGGEPLRAGLELWLEPADEQEEVYPRRVAGDSVGHGTTARAGAFAVGAYPFRCVSAGVDGAAVYLLARAS